MNDSEIARLEEQLQLKLPPEYIETVRRLAREVKGLTLGPLRRPLFTGAKQLLDMNLSTWRHRKAEWPEGFLYCGAELCGKHTVDYAIDTKEPSLPVWEFHVGKPWKFEPSSKCPNLQALYEYAIRTYRELSAREEGKRRKGKRRTAAPTASAPEPSEEPAVSPRPADPRLVEEMAKLVQKAGFDPVKPKRNQPLELLTADFLPALPKDLHALYTLCNGGRCNRYRLKILPLAEAAEYAKTLFRGWQSTGLFPFVQAEQASIECCVSTKGPLEDYVIWLVDGHYYGILARSLNRFFEVLAENLATGESDFEEAMLFDDSPRLPFEFAGNERTADDLRRAREMIQLAKQRVEAHEPGDDEYRMLFEIGWDLLSEQQAEEIIPFLKHPNAHVSTDAKIHLSGVLTPEVGRAFEEIEPELTCYTQEAVRVLRKAGLDAQQVHGVWIRVDPGPKWIGPVNPHFERRASPDHWEWFVKWAKHRVSG